MLIKCILLILVFVSTELIAADVCSNIKSGDKSTKSVDLSGEMPPLRDQDSIGWCYGFVAADLMGHYLYKNPKSVKGIVRKPMDFKTKDYSISALGVATLYNKVKNPDYMKSIRGKSLVDLNKEKKRVVAEAGGLNEALDIIKDHGFCFEKDASSEDYSFVEDSRCAFRHECKITEVLNIIYESSQPNVSCQDLSNIGRIFSGLNFKTINEILTNSERENALTRLVEASCKRQLKRPIFFGGPKTVNYNVEGGHKTEDMMKSLDNHLDRGIPVGVLYYSDFLNGVDRKSSRHASSIVGKRFNPQTCEVEYILRNSWGYGCGHYQKENPGYSKCFKELSTTGSPQQYYDNLMSCRKKFPPLLRNPKVVCDDSNSHVYIRKSDMQKYVYATTAIEEDGFKF